MIVILRGIPGAGKSSWAAQALYHKRFPEPIKGPRLDELTICSADLFFYDEAGNYNFDPARIGEAHAECFRRYLHALRSTRNSVIVDNTNITAYEVAPYVLAAQAFNRQYTILTLLCDPEVAIARQVHGVPAERVREKVEDLKRLLPIFWNHVVYDKFER